MSKRKIRTIQVSDSEGEDVSAHHQTKRPALSGEPLPNLTLPSLPTAPASSSGDFHEVEVIVVSDTEQPTLTPPAADHELSSDLSDVSSDEGEVDVEDDPIAGLRELCAQSRKYSPDCGRFAGEPIFSMSLMSFYARFRRQMSHPITNLVEIFAYLPIYERMVEKKGDKVINWVKWCATMGMNTFRKSIRDTLDDETDSKTKKRLRKLLKEPKEEKLTAGGNVSHAGCPALRPDNMDEWQQCMVTEWITEALRLGIYESEQHLFRCFDHGSRNNMSACKTDLARRDNLLGEIFGGILVIAQGIPATSAGNKLATYRSKTPVMPKNQAELFQKVTFPKRGSLSFMQGTADRSTLDHIVQQVAEKLSVSVQRVWFSVRESSESERRGAEKRIRKELLVQLRGSFPTVSAMNLGRHLYYDLCCDDKNYTWDRRSMTNRDRLDMALMLAAGATVPMLATVYDARISNIREFSTKWRLFAAAKILIQDETALDDAVAAMLPTNAAGESDD